MLEYIDLVQPFRWDNLLGNTMDNYLLQRELAFSQPLLHGEAQISSLLEVGCGSGRLTRVLSGMVPNVVGLDFDSVPLISFRQKSAKIPLVGGDVRNLPLKDHCFDCVVAIQCLLNFDHFQFLRECNRVLKNDGLLICQFLNLHSYKWISKRLLGRDVQEIVYQSYDEFAHDVVKFGFDIKQVSGYNWVPFDRFSDSALVSPMALVEKILRLDRLYNISPWVLVAARKRNS